MDLVRIFETYCNANDIVFKYGSRSHLNLINTTSDNLTKTHLLLFPVKRTPSQNSTKTGFKGTQFTGKFLLVKSSKRDKEYMNKFTDNIEPLISTHKAIGKDLMCQDLELSNWSGIDAIDILDANKDGLWCDYTIIQE